MMYENSLQQLLKIVGSTKSIKILGFLVNFRDGIRLNDLARRAEISPQELYKILSRLRDAGLVAKQENKYTMTLAGYVLLKNILELDRSLKKLQQLGNIAPPNIPETIITNLTHFQGWEILTNFFTITEYVKTIVRESTFYAITRRFIMPFEEIRGSGYLIIIADNSKIPLHLGKIPFLNVRILNEDPKMEMIACDNKGLIFFKNINENLIEYDRALFIKGKANSSLLKKTFCNFWNKSKAISLN